MCKADCSQHTTEQKKVSEDFDKRIEKELSKAQFESDLQAAQFKINHIHLMYLCDKWNEAEEDRPSLFDKMMSKYASLYNLSSVVLAGEFEVAPSTIDHWKKGSVIPHSVVQNFIVNKIIKRVKEG